MSKWLASWALILVLSLSVAPAPGEAQAPADSAAAVRVAEGWLELLDRGELARSWEEAAPRFQRQMSAAEWGRLIQSVREPMGAFVNRTLYRVFRSETSTAEAEVLVVEFGARFADLDFVQERIVLQRDDAGRWRVGGAFIQPQR